MDGVVNVAEYDRIHSAHGLFMVFFEIIFPIAIGVIILRILFWALVAYIVPKILIPIIKRYTRYLADTWDKS